MPQTAATHSIAPVKAVHPAPGLHAHAGHLHHLPAQLPGSGAPSLSRTAWRATLHCLTGCGIGEVLGLVLGTAWGWSNGATLALAVGLAFLFGYLLTAIPLLQSGLPTAQALKLTLAADTASIAIMELVDNGVMLAIPGAMDAPLDSPLFWGSMGIALGIAAIAAFPVNRWLIARGVGHALVHVHH